MNYPNLPTYCFLSKSSYLRAVLKEKCCVANTLLIICRQPFQKKLLIDFETMKSYKPSSRCCPRLTAVGVLDPENCESKSLFFLVSFGHFHCRVAPWWGCRRPIAERKKWNQNIVWPNLPRKQDFSSHEVCVIPRHTKARTWVDGEVVADLDRALHLGGDS